MRLKDKVALITGGGRGIGSSIARMYAREGAFVFIVSRTSGELDKVASEIKQDKKRAISFVCDISNGDDISALYDEISSSFGRLDILVNNAGILGEMKELKDYSVDVWKSVIDINLSSVFHLTKVMLPLLMKVKSSSIINVSSGVAKFPRGGWGAYGVSKCALEYLSKLLSEELYSHFIRVNTVDPGATRTRMRKAAYPDEDPLSLKSPDEILDVFLYLAMDSPNFVSGKSFNAQSFYL